MSDWDDDGDYGRADEEQAEDDYQHEIAIADAMDDRERDEDEQARRRREQ